MLPAHQDEQDHRSQLNVVGLRRFPVLLVGLPFVILLFIFLAPQLTFPFEKFLVWVLCLSLLVLLEVIEKPEVPRFLYGYHMMAVVLCWFDQGFLPALIMLLVASASVALIRQRTWVRAGPVAGVKPNAFREIYQNAVPLALGLAAASALYTLFNGQLPLMHVSVASFFPILIPLLAFYLLASAAAHLLKPPVTATPISLTDLWKGQQLSYRLNDIAVFPLMIGFPLILNSAGVGIFGLTMFMTAVFVVKHDEASRTLTRNTAIHRQNADLLQKLTLVNRSVQNAMFNVDQQIALKTACETALAVSQADKVAIFLASREQDKLVLSESLGFGDTSALGGREIPYEARQASSRAIIVSDTLQTAETATLAEFNKHSTFRAFVEMPVSSGSTILGYLTVYHNQPHRYSATEIELLEILTNQLASALDNTQLLSALELHAFEMTHLVRLSRISASGLELNQVATDVADVLRQMTAMDWVTIALLENNTNRIRIIGATRDIKPMDMDTSTPLLPQFPEVQEIRTSGNASPVVIQLDDPKASRQIRSFMENDHLATLIIAPMTAYQSIFGVIFVGTVAPQNFSEREEQLIEASANQIATQLYNLQVYQVTLESLNGRLEQLALIEDIVQRISSSHDSNAIINDVFEAAVKSTQADTVALAILTEADDFWVIEQNYADGKSTRNYAPQRRDEGIIGRVGQTAEPVLTPDNAGVPYYLASHFGVYASSLAVPLQKNNVVVGVLNVESRKKNFFNMGQADFLRNLGAHAMISIENSRLVEELRYKVETLTSLRELSLSLSTAVNIGAVAQNLVKAALDILGGQYAVLFHHHKSTDQFILMEQSGVERAPGMHGEETILMEIAHDAIRTGKTQTIDNIKLQRPERAPENLHYPAMLAIPIVAGNNVDEVLCVAFTEQKPFESSDLNTISLLAIQAAGHLENAALHEQIRAGNNRMKAILDSTRDGVILLDNKGQIVEVNPAAQRLIGVPLNEHVGESFVDILLNSIEPDAEGQAGYSREELTRLARVERLEPEGITQREFTRRVQSNQVIHVRESGAPVIGEDHQKVGRLLVLRDVTEEKMLESYREEITSMAVHDLRSPLASIIDAVRIALENIDRPAGTDVAKQTLNLALSSTDKLMNLVNSLLDIRKGKRMELEKTPISVMELLETARLTLLSSAQKSNIPIEIEVPSGIPPVYVDAEKIRRVLVNLLDNSLRFSPAGKPVKVIVKNDSSHHKVIIQVADNGPGIPAAERDRVFEQFWQVKNNQPLRGSKGSGIGLAFCQRVLEAHGERIWVEAQGPLPGACFSFSLPAV